MGVQDTMNFPPFWRSFPALWFYQVETEFRKQQIFSEPTMKFYIMKSLKANIVAEVEENISSPLDELPYYHLKQALQGISKLPPSVRHVSYLQPVIQSIAKASHSVNGTPLRPPPASVFPKPASVFSKPLPVSSNSAPPLRGTSPYQNATRNKDSEKRQWNFPLVPSQTKATNSRSSNSNQAKNKPNFAKETTKSHIIRKPVPALDWVNENEHVRTVSLRERQTAFAKLLKHLLDLLKKKDKERFFKQPVTRSIAPDYFEVIKSPMDFYSMDKKLKSDKYNELTEFRSDADLICGNAMLYNHRLSIFHIKAKELQTYIDSIFNPDSISLLAKNFPYIKDIPSEKLGFELDLTVEEKKVGLKKEERNETDEMSDYEKLRAKNIAARMKMFEEMKRSATTAIESIKPPKKKIKKEIIKEEDFLIPKIERKSSRAVKAIDYKYPAQRARNKAPAKVPMQITHVKAR